MDEQKTPTGVDVAAFEATKQALKDCQQDRSALQGQIDSLLQNLWTESLRVVEEILKYKQGDSGEKAQLFQAYKSRILNAGNREKRQVPLILGDYVVQQIYVRESVTRQINTPYKVPNPRGN